MLEATLEPKGTSQPVVLDQELKLEGPKAVVLEQGKPSDEPELEQVDEKVRSPDKVPAGRGPVAEDQRELVPESDRMTRLWRSFWNV